MNGSIQKQNQTTHVCSKKSNKLVLELKPLPVALKTIKREDRILFYFHHFSNKMRKAFNAIIDAFQCSFYEGESFPNDYFLRSFIKSLEFNRLQI